MGYADDHAVYDSFKAASRQEQHLCINNLQKCLDEIGSWMSSKRLKMNDSKTKAILFGTVKQPQKYVTNSITVGEADISCQLYIKYLELKSDATT